MPSDVMLKFMNTAHRGLLKLSFGKFGWTAAGMPVVELTTVGRKTGQRRSVMLTSPLQVGESVIIVASRGGDDHHPAWFHNLSADPKVEVSYRGGPAAPWTARVATTEERAEWWPKVTAKYRNYGGYQRKTEREIPLVVLTPDTP
jgi:deazaflavin-dependent oxidoreductase (nitroreductase family)